MNFILVAVGAPLRAANWREHLRARVFVRKALGSFESALFTKIRYRTFPKLNFLETHKFATLCLIFM